MKRAAKSRSSNKFLSSINKHNTVTENMAVAHSSTGSILADQFSKSGAHRDRDFNTVFAEQALLHGKHGIDALRFVFYLRMVTRKVHGIFGTTEKVQRGQGNRDESFKRFLFYAKNHPETFYKNLPLFLTIGCVRDCFDLMIMAEEAHIRLDNARMFEAILKTCEDDSMTALMFKYMPHIVASSKATTDRAKARNRIARQFASYLELSPVDYRHAKSSKGDAHRWQQYISNQRYKKIDFNAISGRALTQLISSSFLETSGLKEKYAEWIAKQPVAKFTGYVHELGMKAQRCFTPAMQMTLNKQFDGLIDLAKKDDGAIKENVLVAIDCSGSMNTGVAGTTAMNISKSLGIYFSTLMDGDFHKKVVKFSQHSQLVSLSGDFVDMYQQINWGDCPSNTDFQSVIDVITRARIKNKDIPLEDFPTCVLVVSDMQFDPSGVKTNYEMAIRKLSEFFPKSYTKKFKFVWWDCTGRVTTNQPQSIDEPGGYVLSGFDGAVISLLLGGKPKSEKDTPDMEEAIKDALNQEILVNCELA